MTVTAEIPRHESSGRRARPTISAVSLAGLPEGRFLVAWTRSRPRQEDGSLVGVKSRGDLGAQGPCDPFADRCIVCYPGSRRSAMRNRLRSTPEEHPITSGRLRPRPSAPLMAWIESPEALLGGHRRDCGRVVERQPPCPERSFAWTSRLGRQLLSGRRHRCRRPMNSTARPAHLHRAATAFLPAAFGQRRPSQHRDD